MGVVASYRIRKSIHILLTSSDINTPQTAQAITHLKEMGSTAVPKLLEVLDRQHIPAVITDLLTTFVRDDTLPLYIRELANSSPQVVTGVTNILSTSYSYNPNNLVEYCGDAKLSQSALIRILSSHKDRLSLQAIQNLLARMGDKENRTLIIRFVEETATEAMIPVLLPWTQHDDWIIRLSMTRILSRFHMPQIESTLVQLLVDPHKSIRQTALEGLAGIQNPATIGAICKLIRDPDLTVQNKAIEIITQMKAPQTVSYLLELLQDDSEYVRRGAVEVLNSIADTSAIKDLLGALRDKDWWVRVRAADALGTIGGPTVVEAVLELMQDEDAFIRRTAVEILNTTHDERAFRALVNAVKDDDWWVRERAIDALAKLGDVRAVPALVPILDKDPDTSRVTLRALGTLGDQRALDPVLGMLHSADHTIVKEALQALLPLTHEQHAAKVQHTVFHLTQHADASITNLAQVTLKTLIDRWGNRVASAKISSPPETSGTLPSQVTSQLEDKAHQETLRVGPSSNLPDSKTASGERASVSVLDLDALEPDTVLQDRYRVIRRVGKGAFGTALLVEDTAVHENIVLKFLNAQLAVTEQTVKRFIRELRYSRKITHENVIRIYDFLTFGSTYAISMEYFESHALAAYLQSNTRIPARSALKIVQSICNGMRAAHQVEVIHRDLKPANILVNQEGLLKIVDFGLAAAVSHNDSRVTRSGAMVGTPAYMSPEQIRGEELDARADIYSLGVIMYELFTGRPPYVGKDTVSVIYQHIQGQLTPPREVNPDITPEMEAIILKAMAVDANKRHQSMDAVLEVLDQVEVG